MANPNGVKGASFERAVADYLSQWWEWADRKTKTGAKDTGDITGIRSWTFELKNTKSLDFSAAVKEAITEAGNSGSKWYAAVVKRKGTNVIRSYVVMELEQLVRIILAMEGRSSDDVVEREAA